MSGIYVHIPFCRQSCIYCNFFFKTGQKLSEPVRKALLREIGLKSSRLGPDTETVYFGGGTPSFPEATYIEEIFESIKEASGRTSFSEVTLEANPDDMSEEKLRAWKDMGVNRLSVGVQSFYDEHLRWMNRAHTSDEAAAALNRAVDMGFDLNVDLIFGIPGSTPEQWESNLERAIGSGACHLSCYGLTLEEKTPWVRAVETGKRSGPDEALTAAMFRFTMDYLRGKGWEQYEISNYSLPGKRALHNSSYWEGRKYTGIGPSAHSYDGVSRSWNVADMESYISALEQGQLPEESEVLGKKELHNEYVMTALRRSEGIDMRKMRELSGDGHLNDEVIGRYIGSGFMRMTGDRLVLTDEGKMYADAIAAEFFLV